MRKLLILILFVVCSVSLKGQIRLAGYISTIGSLDTYPTHVDSLGMGGYVTTCNITTRNAIPAARRKKGMIVRYNCSSDSMFVLSGGITNSDWVLFSSSGVPGTGTVTSIATTYPVQGGTITTTGTISVDTTANIGALASNYDVANTDSVGTISRGTWQGISIDTTYTNAVSNVTANSPLSVATGGKTKVISADTSASVTALTTHYQLNNTDSVGTIVRGVWNGTSIDTTYTNAVSNVVNDYGVIISTGGKTKGITVDSTKFATSYDLTTVSGDNIYNTDDTLTARRTLYGGDSTLTFTDLDTCRVEAGTIVFDGSDRTQFLGSTVRFTVLSSAGFRFVTSNNAGTLGSVKFPLDSSNTANVVTKVERKEASDSVFVWRNGTQEFAYLDSIGAGTITNVVGTYPVIVNTTGTTVTVSADTTNNGGMASNYDVAHTDSVSGRPISLGGTLTTASSFTTSGANALTLTTTGATGVTLPTSGTLYGTLSGSISSAQLATSLTNEEGNPGKVVFSDDPTFTTKITTPKLNGGIASGDSLIIQPSSHASSSKDIVFMVGASAGQKSLRLKSDGRMTLNSLTGNYNSISSAYNSFSMTGLSSGGGCNIDLRGVSVADGTAVGSVQVFTGNTSNIDGTFQWLRDGASNSTSFTLDIAYTGSLSGHRVIYARPSAYGASLGLGGITPTLNGKVELTPGDGTMHPVMLGQGVRTATPVTGGFDYEYVQPDFTNEYGIRQQMPLVQQRRVTSQFDKTDDALADVTELVVDVANGGSYRFEATLFVDADATGGTNFAIGGTCTASYIIYQIVETVEGPPGDVVLNSRHTSIGDSDGENSYGATEFFTKIQGYIIADDPGQLSVQFAQFTSNNTSSVLVGSTFVLTQME